ncbi:hypothetical protein IRZ83_13305 [Flavobacterium sp. JLP]|uniref:hypothetical protein n=1 Tax=unclassified Flavobacterium TaxID=196869 RepID=UPI00188B142B|nr:MULTISPECIES: hypothetical protein [unclassified Flavobacterium]MBF4494251.1 hypothetical protein [Flavobacterium sp. MR2016-29]MBF4507647.1 hypothetical protein [Flavobacterium sp. JLP]
MKTLTFYIAFLFASTLLFLNRYSDLYINNSITHFILLIIASITLILILGQVFGKLKTVKSRLLTVLIVVFVCFIQSFLTWGGDWKTQTILYRNLTNDNNTIEFQMRGDRFSFGYKKRVINRLKLFPGFDWTTDIDTNKINHKQWKKLNLYVNEMKFASN